jgi:hypothetical protein
MDKHNFNDIDYNSAYASDKMIGTLIVGKCIARDVIFMSSLWDVVLSSDGRTDDRRKVMAKA